MCANALARRGSSSMDSLITWDSCPPFVSSLLLAVALGVLSA